MEDIFRYRLLTLASFLEQLPEERFNYASWVGDDWQGKPDLSCGTTACALGWATTIPELSVAGLKLVRNCEEIGYVTLNDRDASIYDSPMACAKEACEKVFGLKREETEYLFSPDRSLHPFDYRSPNRFATAKEVAEHIRNFVNQKDSE